MWSAQIPASDTVLREWEQEVASAARFDFRASPAERREYAERAAQLRAAERERAKPVEPTVGALAYKFGWTPAQVRHLAQPYCCCDIGHDGWEWCRHAYDERLVGRF